MTDLEEQYQDEYRFTKKLFREGEPFTYKGKDFIKYNGKVFNIHALLESLLMTKNRIPKKKTNE